MRSTTVTGGVAAGRAAADAAVSALVEAVRGGELRFAGHQELCELLRSVIGNTSAHVVAMTGSYFRGDAVPVLVAEDEARFTKVTYNYYDQLNGYTYMKSLGIGYHFYQGRYTEAIGEVLDTDKKTILHIPSVQSGESTKDKLREVDEIIDSFGEVDHQDEKTGVIFVKRHSDQEMIKVADLSRQGFMNGDISTVMSPRTVISWAQNAHIFGDVGYAFRVSFLNKCDDAERTLVAEYYQRVFASDLPESVVGQA